MGLKDQQIFCPDWLLIQQTTGVGW